MKEVELHRRAKDFLMHFFAARWGGKEANRAHLTEPVCFAVGFGRFFAFRCIGNGGGDAPAGGGESSVGAGKSTGRSTRQINPADQPGKSAA
jgi:hypothetical protein